MAILQILPLLAHAIPTGTAISRTALPGTLQNRSVGFASSGCGPIRGRNRVRKELLTGLTSMDVA